MRFIRRRVGPSSPAEIEEPDPEKWAAEWEAKQDKRARRQIAARQLLPPAVELALRSRRQKAARQVLLPAVERALRRFADDVDLRDAECGPRPWTYSEIPTTTLAWKAADGISRNIHVVLYMEGWGGFPLFVEGNAWTETESGVIRALRNIQVGEIANAIEVPADRLDSNLDRQVREAYDRLSRITESELSEPYYESTGDPGPISTDKYMGQ
jgi:hypothetical protein